MLARASYVAALPPKFGRRIEWIREERKRRGGKKGKTGIARGPICPVWYSLPGGTPTRNKKKESTRNLWGLRKRGGGGRGGEKRGEEDPYLSQQHNLLLLKYRDQDRRQTTKTKKKKKERPKKRTKDQGKKKGRKRGERRGKEGSVPRPTEFGFLALRYSERGRGFPCGWERGTEKEEGSKSVRAETSGGDEKGGRKERSPPCVCYKHNHAGRRRGKLKEKTRRTVERRRKGPAALTISNYLLS